jgi:hypothetical protein
MKTRVVVAALFVVAIATGCGWFQSGEAQIVSFSFQGIDIVFDVDPETNTVTVSAPAVDLLAVTAQIAVSEGATITEPEPFEDGVPQTLVVTAENGDAVEWEATVNLRLGMSFQLDGEWLFFEHGLTDSSNPELADDLGDGVPLCSLYTGEGDLLDMWASSATVDLFEPGPEVGYLAITLDLPASESEWTTTTYTVGGDYGLYVEGFSEVPDMSPTDGQASLTSAPGAEGEIATGTFELSDATTEVKTGFFKLKRVMDNAYDYFPFGGGLPVD